MITDFDNPGMVGGVIVFPSWPYEDQPKPLPIIETVYLQANPPGNPAVTGNPDTEENNP